MVFGTNAAERMRIDSSGNLLVGTTTAGASGTTLRGAPTATNYAISTSGGGVVQAKCIEAVTGQLGTSYGAIEVLTANPGDGYFISFNAPDGSYNYAIRGSIALSGTSVAYNTSSDQRLKENIADADDAGSKVDAIQVRQFDWKADGSHQDYGMVAQELLTVAPEAVSVPEDPEEMMGVDYSKLVPMLVKEIQSLRARVAQLEGGQ